jgi:WhiB family redox-sensing transcriptional regulator
MSTRDGRRALDGREPETDLVGRILRLVASTPTRRLGSRARIELRALVAPRWQEQAACVSADPEAWFPVKGGTRRRQVNRICAGCPVNRSCLAVAMLWNEDGIWGGTSPKQRTRGYRLLRHGVSASTVVELLLAQLKRRRSVRYRWSGKATPATPVRGPRALPHGDGSGGQEAA